jgi:hypothetical protein
MSDAIAQTNSPAERELKEVIEKYFELLFTCDVSSFDEVFADQASLYGDQAGTVLVWPATQYREILSGRQSPKSLGASREDEIMDLDIVNATMACVKVKLRANEKRFIDYLTFIKLASGWRIVSKTYQRLS